VKRIFTNRHFLSLAANIFTSFISFLSILLLARVLSPADMGEWLLYVTIFTFADMLRSGLVHVPFIQMYANNKDVSVCGSAWVISMGVTATASIICYSFSVLCPAYIQQLHLGSFAYYFPVLFIASLPYNIGLWLQQAENNFNQVLNLRLLMSIPFFIVIVFGLTFPFDVHYLIKAHILCYTFASTTSILSGWSNLWSVFKATQEKVKILLGFGKYSTGTLICSNLLKSSDTILISWYLGPTAVAAYNLPYKLIELIEIPLRSVVATSLPQLSTYSQQKNFTKVQQMFNEHTGLLSIVIVPFVILILFFASELVVMAGGKQYVISANIFRVFAIYSLLLPLDRFIGVTLDSIGKPHLNLLKVLLMVVMNVAGSLFVLEFFKSPLLVAAITILTTCCGIAFGIFILNKFFPFSGKQVLMSGYQLILNSINKLTHAKA
jgi:O-antigen/teichoic acid export membrane protein